VPGYAALFREADGDLNFCCYIIPGGACTLDDLQRMHHQLLREHPLIREALGPDAVVEHMRAAPLRLGGIARSYHEGLLIVGDAAGQIDPLTGEGIHLAMDAAEIAAITIDEALGKGDLGARFLKRYQDRWMRAFGRDFFWSRLIARTYTRWPLLLDASSAAMQRQGLDRFVEWGRAMTGQTPKWTFLKPRLVAPIVVETIRQLARRAAGRETRTGLVAIDRSGARHPFDIARAAPPAPRKRDSAVGWSIRL
jgi:flavin-dependent dehydrogenase